MNIHSKYRKFTLTRLLRKHIAFTKKEKSQKKFKSQLSRLGCYMVDLTELYGKINI